MDNFFKIKQTNSKPTIYSKQSNLKQINSKNPPQKPIKMTNYLSKIAINQRHITAPKLHDLLVPKQK